jgi:superfamily II DNA or RNA helicase
LQLPTGAGKTYTFCEIAKRSNKKTLIIVHRTELMNQAKNSLGEKCFLIKKGVKIIPDDYDYYVGMVETVNKRLLKLPKFELVIIDEFHI